MGTLIEAKQYHRMRTLGRPRQGSGAALTHKYTPLLAAPRVSELELEERRVAVRVDEDRPQDLYVLILAGLHVLVQEVHSPPVPALGMRPNPHPPERGEEGVEPPH